MKKLVWAVIALFMVTGCTQAAPPAAVPIETATAQPTETPADAYRNVYEIYVGSFYDSNGDGMGDLRGVTEKLDYIAGADGLGADAIWMMPVMPSPTYHKYDVTDYYAIDPAYGTMEDFDELLAESEKRGVRIILDLVLNHTSSKHPWFTEAVAEIREGREHKYFNYYNFAEEKVNSTYYATAGGYYYEGDFWDQMPDLNMDDAELRAEIVNIAEFWLDKGVGGFRLDAAMHVYDYEADNLEFWTWFADECKKINPDVYLVAEVWDTDGAIMPYYGTGLTSMFNFGFSGPAGSVAGAIRRKNGQTLAAQIENYAKLIAGRDPSAINALFLSNHDNDRSAGYFANDEAKMKLAAALYLLIPGNSYIYYGEEIGLTGRGIDENKRAPLIWSVTDTAGQTNGPTAMTERPQMGEGVLEQLAREDSLLNYYRELIAVKNAHPAIARGVPVAIDTGEKALCCYKVTHGDETVLVAHNLSEEPATVTLPADAFAGEIAASLCALDAAADAFTWDGANLSVPAYGTVILTGR